MLVALWLPAPASLGQTPSEGLDGSDPGSASSGSIDLLPTPGSSLRPKEPGVDWNKVMRQSMLFLTLEHSFRLATEAGTREGMNGKFFPTYWQSISNLHGWADGDPFYVNYVGHPMMGSVAGYLFAQNDRKYLDVEFGRERRYWKSRLRSGAFAFAYSAQFELGPVSEASIGKIQRKFPQQGYVDLVVTPFFGTAWTLAEDAVDQYLVRRVEQWTQNNWIRLLARGGLNPARSAANVLAGKAPWYRTNRAGVYAPYSYVIRPAAVDREMEPNPPPGVAPFEFNLNFQPQYFPGTGVSCLGGGGSIAMRLAAAWQMIMEVSGCNMAGLEKDLSGDGLTFLAGPRWRPAVSGRLSPHLQFMAGAQKLTQERFYPEVWRKLQPLVEQSLSPALYRDQYTSREETTAFALSAGGGLDFRFNDALALTLGNLEYRRSWVRRLDGMNFSGGIQFSTGVVLSMGTW
ncbi:MAG TPA: hypothetical protein VM120_18720 [Bryobacteraceae bacterium]|nr:hypothetical protein [Bryobacteraceae bacterium]